MLGADLPFQKANPMAEVRVRMREGGHICTIVPLAYKAKELTAPYRKRGR